MKKRRFTYAERYAVWLNHKKKCWLCGEPLRLAESTIDHFIPEILLENDTERKAVLEEYGLPPDFNINGFENWLPCHHLCNQNKGSKPLKFVPGNMVIVERLIRKAPEVLATWRKTLKDSQKDKLLSGIYIALEKQAISLRDLQSFIADLGGFTEMIQIDNGYWLAKDDIARECQCQCERDACVGDQSKVHCLFSRFLSDWVITKGLYWKCYDEFIVCPRCKLEHKRGHIGRAEICERPYADQVDQID